MAFEDYKAFGKACAEAIKTVDKELKQIAKLYEAARDNVDELTDTFRSAMVQNKGRAKHLADLDKEALAICDEAIPLEQQLAKLEKAGDQDALTPVEARLAALAQRYEKLMVRRARIVRELEGSDTRDAHDRAERAVKLAKTLGI